MNLPIVTDETYAVAVSRCWPGRAVYQTSPGSPAREYFLYAPHSAHAGSPVIVLAHGITRNASEHVFRFRHAADSSGAILLAPLFAKHRYGQYQQVVDGRRGIRADLALFDMLDAVASQTGVSVERIHLFGFSGGAQFAHRFMMLHPERVAAVAIAAAGWYTLPVPSLQYPFGIGTHPLAGGSFAPDRFLRVPRHVLVGEQDIARDDALRMHPDIDRLQGENRLARARCWFDLMQREAHQRGEATVRSSFTILPGAGHSFTEAAQRHDLAAAVCRRFGLLSTH